VRVIFAFPEQVQSVLGLQKSPSWWPKEPLAYIEWYKALRSTADETTGMYIVKRTSQPEFAIIPISHIRQSCMLIPRFSDDFKRKTTNWTSTNVLDLAPYFYLNNWQSPYAYQTIW